MNSTAAKVKDISTEDRLLTVWLNDGRILSLPLAWYPSLAKATREERAVWQVSGAGKGIHWPALDYDLSVEGLLAGRHEHPNALAWTREARARNKAARRTPVVRKSTGKRASPAKT